MVGKKRLDADGFWVCAKGHRKEITGAYPGNGKCIQCAIDKRVDRVGSYQYNGFFEEMANLRAVREGFGLSQEKLARLSGVPRGTISNIELGLSQKPGQRTRRMLISYFAPLIARRKKLGLEGVPSGKR